MQNNDLKVNNLNVKKAATVNKLVAKSIRFNEINCVNVTMDTLTSTNTIIASGPTAFDVTDTLTADGELITSVTPVFDPSAFYVRDGNLVHIFTAFTWSAPFLGEPESTASFYFEAPIEPETGVFQNEYQASGSVYLPDFNYTVYVKAQEGTKNILFAIAGDQVADGVSHFWITYSLKQIPP